MESERDTDFGRDERDVQRFGRVEHERGELHGYGYEWNREHDFERGGGCGGFDDHVESGEPVAARDAGGNVLGCGAGAEPVHISVVSDSVGRLDRDGDFGSDIAGLHNAWGRCELQRREVLRGRDGLVHDAAQQQQCKPYRCGGKCFADDHHSTRWTDCGNRGNDVVHRGRCGIRNADVSVVQDSRGIDDRDRGGRRDVRDLQRSLRPRRRTRTTATSIT